ncbi:hypothetical protein D3C72_1300460 [compost metagenome]
MVTAIVPIRMRRVLVPMAESVTSAMRRSSPVTVMAAEMNSAAATSASAVFEKPASAMPSAREVPYCTLGSLTVGAKPIRPAISDVIMIALVSYETASVIHTTMAKARMASMRWPAMVRPSGCGIASTPSSTATATNRPQCSVILGAVALAVAAVGGAVGGVGEAGEAGEAWEVSGIAIILVLMILVECLDTALDTACWRSVRQAGNSAGGGIVGREAASASGLLQRPGFWPGRRVRHDRNCPSR